MIRPMVSYQAVNFGADTVMVGVVGAMFALAPLLLAIPVGRQIDRGLAGTALFAGSLLATLAGLGLQIAKDITSLILLMPVLGLGHLLGMVGGQTLISQKSPGSSLEKNFGLLTFYASLGHALGPFFGGLLATESKTGVYVGSAIWLAIALLAASAIVTALTAKPNLVKDRNLVRRGSFARVISTPGYVPAIFVAGMVTAVVDVLLVFLPVIGLALGFTASQVGLLLAARAIGSMASRLVLGKMTALFGFRRLLIFSSILALLGILALALISNFISFIAMIFLVGIALAVGQPLTMAWVSRIAPEDAKGMAISVRLTSNRLGQVVVPAIAGSIAGIGIFGIFYLLSALLGLAAVSAWLALGPNREKK